MLLLCVHIIYLYRYTILSNRCVPQVQAIKCLLSWGLVHRYILIFIIFFFFYSLLIRFVLPQGSFLWYHNKVANSFISHLCPKKLYASVLCYEVSVIMSVSTGCNVSLTYTRSLYPVLGCSACISNGLVCLVYPLSALRCLTIAFFILGQNNSIEITDTASF